MSEVKRWELGVEVSTGNVFARVTPVPAHENTVDPWVKAEDYDRLRHAAISAIGEEVGYDPVASAELLDEYLALEER